jgi:hypothetical protein
MPLSQQETMAKQKPGHLLTETIFLAGRYLVRKETEAAFKIY